MDNLETRKQQRKKERIQKNIEWYDRMLAVPPLRFILAAAGFWILVGGLNILVYFETGNPFSWPELGRQLLLWSLSGILFGICMRWFYGWHRNKMRRKLDASDW